MRVTAHQPNRPELLTLEEAAEILRKTPAQMRWMRFNGTGPKSALIGGRVMYRMSDISAFIADAFDH